MKEPLWKTILNWGTVIAFFVVPTAFFIMHINGSFTGMTAEDFKYIETWLRNLTFLVFGLAGMKAAQYFKNGHNGDKK
jgi:putative Ca2+/H+ antiporter (TMEM165/GDT1 family)